MKDGATKKIDSLVLDVETSNKIFQRKGEVLRIDVDLHLEKVPV